MPPLPVPALPALDVSRSPDPSVDGHCSSLKALASKGLNKNAFVTSKNHHYFPFFLPCYLPSSVLFFLFIQLIKFAFQLELFQNTGNIPHL